MKPHSMTTRSPLVGGLLILALAAPGLLAQTPNADNSRAPAAPNNSRPPISAPPGNPGAVTATPSARPMATFNAEEVARDPSRVAVTRASSFFGSDVYSSDGRKVGDIVDYYYTLSPGPAVTYVVVVTGGFMDVGGDRRAIPISGLAITDNRVQVRTDSGTFYNIPVLPEDRNRFMTDARNREQLQSYFPPRTAATVTSPDRNLSMTGREVDSGLDLVAHSVLLNELVFGTDNRELGKIKDLWVNLDDGRLSHVEVTGTYRIFRGGEDSQFAVPVAAFTGKHDGGGYNVNLTGDDFNRAKPELKAEGVELINDGKVGRPILIVPAAGAAAVGTAAPGVSVTVPMPYVAPAGTVTSPSVAPIPGAPSTPAGAMPSSERPPEAQ